MSTLERTQILLEPRQRRALRDKARRAGRSVSDLIREMIERDLAEEAREAKKARVREALEWLGKLRAKIEAEHGVLNVDFVEEVREEADAHWDEILGSIKK